VTPRVASRSRSHERGGTCRARTPTCDRPRGRVASDRARVPHEQATYAATLVRVAYAPAKAITDVSQVDPVLPTQQKTDQGSKQPPETRRGDPEDALARAEVKIDHNPKTSRRQCIGGMIGVIGMALMEHSVVDARSGRVPNANLAEYAVPVHADAPPVMDVIFVEEHDPT
jgi:CO/xanthine dehydrogenase Mo-binding subunit